MTSGPADLHRLGQSLWLDNITRGMLDDGTLQRYIRDLSVTGLTSNPTIFNAAVKNTSFYDAAIAAKVRQGKAGERLFFELAIEDLQRAADLFRPVFDRTGGLDGWVSLEVSPTLAYDTASTLAAARDLHARADRPNLFIKIPGTPEGLPAIEEAIFAGVPVNVTLLFTRDHFLAAEEAYLRGIHRRIEAGLSPRVCSVASLFISRWDGATASTLPAALANRLGLAVGQQSYRAYRDLLASDRFQRLANFGALPQRLLYASTGTKDPQLPDTLYVSGLASPHTVNTMPEQTLLAFADHGAVAGIVSAGGGDADETLLAITRAGIDVAALGAKLQKDGAESFVKSWTELLQVIEKKSQAVSAAGGATR
ncbi:MAG: transaldolase [Planctomycetia bacterium]|nr:transaldolase [Planctomycetia bacterium]